MVLPVVVSFLVRGPTFIRLWMGPEYGGPAGEVLRILALGLCVFTGYHVLVSNIVALNLHRGLVAPFVVEAIANLSLSVVLGAYMGVDGVAWGTTLPRVALAVGFAPWFVRRKLGMGVREYATHVWVRPLASMIPFGVASALIERWWPASNLVVFFTQVGVALPLAALGAWVVGLESGERQKIVAVLREYWAGPRLVSGNGVGPA
jgi:O-antigen/teichoic acid export membrane protein